MQSFSIMRNETQNAIIVDPNLSHAFWRAFGHNPILGVGVPTQGVLADERQITGRLYSWVLFPSREQVG